MVTRRSVLKGAAAASIGAIAAAHGAPAAEAAAFDVGYGQLAGGAVGGFYKYRDSFQIALKFHKVSAEIFLKEDVTGVAIFLKYFDTDWRTVATQQLPLDAFPDLKTTDLYFSKIHPSGAEFFIKNELNKTLRGTFETSGDGVFHEFLELNTDGEIG